MNNNQKRNSIAIKKYRKELMALIDDVSEIDKKVINRAVNEGLAVAKENTTVDTGFMRRSWGTTPTTTEKGVTTKSLINTADYSSYVNYGHRIVTKKGVTVGFIKGKFMLEKAVSHAEKSMNKEFKKEIERIKREHGV